MPETKFTPFPILLSKTGRENLPETLKEYNVWWQVEPESNGKVFICGEPETNGRACTYVKAEWVVPLSDACAICRENGTNVNGAETCKTCPFYEINFKYPIDPDEKYED